MKIFYGSNDDYVSPTDVERLITELELTPKEYHSNHFTHSDFISSPNAPKMFSIIVGICTGSI